MENTSLPQRRFFHCTIVSPGKQPLPPAFLYTGTSGGKSALKLSCTFPLTFISEKHIILFAVKTMTAYLLAQQIFFHPNEKKQEVIMSYVLLSALPFLTALVLMVGFRFSSARSLVISLVLTCALVLGVW
jgi:hypothetical protein